MTTATTHDGGRRVVASREIDAPAQALFDLVADPANHPRLDGSGSVRATRGTVPDRLALDTRFSMDMKIGAPYRITNRVVEFEEGRLLAWRHFFGHRWRWSFEPVDAHRTRVTEEWDARPAPLFLPLKLMGADSAARAGIPRSLDNLAELAGG